MHSGAPEWSLGPGTDTKRRDGLVDGRPPGDSDVVELSVVLACPTSDSDPSSDGDPAGALRALDAGLEGVRAEVLVVRPGGRPEDGDAVDAVPGAASGPSVRRIPGPHDALVPHLWAEGLRRARAGAVAFTTSHLRVDPGWGPALLDALEAHAGAAGPIGLAEGARLVDRAIHLLRYADVDVAERRAPIEQIPGDNAAYRTEALRRNADLTEGGFWEVGVNRALREQGESLGWVPAARARLGRSYGLVPFLRQRFRHGTQFGRYRVRELEVPAWRLVAAAPLVPAVLSVRALSRARRLPGGLRRALPALPWLLLAACAWSAGEARGALTSPDGPEADSGSEPSAA